MPARRPYRKKKAYRKRTYNRAKPRGALAPRAKVYPFSRSTENFLDVSGPTNGWITTADNSLVRSFAWSLNSLTANTEFTSLFNQYKLNYAVVKMYPTVSLINATQEGYSGSQYGGNVIITMWRNTHGVELDASFSSADLLQIQRKRQFMVPSSKPTIIKMPLRQLSQLYSTVTGGGIDYATVKPRYIHTSETHTPHFGLNVHIKKVDGTPFVAGSMDMLIKEQILLTCKQVK